MEFAFSAAGRVPDPLSFDWDFLLRPEKQLLEHGKRFWNPFLSLFRPRVPFPSQITPIHGIDILCQIHTLCSKTRETVCT